MIGLGYDIHSVCEGNRVFLGGVEIPSEFGLKAHSDGDVLLHAVMDAILGAAGLGDIGEHFPDTDPNFRNADSKQLLKHVISLVCNDYKIINIDCTIIAERPKILPFKDRMRETIADICNIPVIRVNIKATTNEKLGSIGRIEGIAAMAACQIEQINEK